MITLVCLSIALLILWRSRAFITFLVFVVHTLWSFRADIVSVRILHSPIRVQLELNEGFVVTLRIGSYDVNEDH